jgi:hypothetical protein
MSPDSFVTYLPDRSPLRQHLGTFNEERSSFDGNDSLRAFANKSGSDVDIGVLGCGLQG